MPGPIQAKDRFRRQASESCTQDQVVSMVYSTYCIPYYSGTRFRGLYFDLIMPVDSLALGKLGVQAVGGLGIR